ncbi:MAG: hypothetical protein K0R36_3192 [Chryseobacterium sp.]|jgi:transcriptional regulator with XRE-family HTH domain|nr:hypothetical protein [Chryseobacterium sp.]
MSLGTKLYELRQRKNLSQAQVALELDISQAAYGNGKVIFQNQG